MTVLDEKLEELLHDLDDGAEDLENESIAEIYEYIKSNELHEQQLKSVIEPVLGFIKRRVALDCEDEQNKKSLEYAINSLVFLEYTDDLSDVFKYLSVIGDKWVEYKGFLDSVLKSDEVNNQTMQKLLHYYFNSYESKELFQHLNTYISELSINDFYECVVSHNHKDEDIGLFGFLKAKGEDLVELSGDKLKDLLKCELDRLLSNGEDFFSKEKIEFYQKIIYSRNGFELFLDFMFEFEERGGSIFPSHEDELDLQGYFNLLFAKISTNEFVEGVLRRESDAAVNVALSLLSYRPDITGVPYLSELLNKEKRWFFPNANIYCDDELFDIDLIFTAIEGAIIECGVPDEGDELLHVAYKAITIISNKNFQSEGYDAFWPQAFIKTFISNGGWNLLLKELPRAEGETAFGNDFCDLAELLDWLVDKKMIPEDKIDDAINVLNKIDEEGEEASGEDFYFSRFESTIEKLKALKKK